jgi:hypothetical protein
MDRRTYRSMLRSCSGLLQTGRERALLLTLLKLSLKLTGMREVPGILTVDGLRN